MQPSVTVWRIESRDPKIGERSPLLQIAAEPRLAVGAGSVRRSEDAHIVRRCFWEKSKTALKNSRTPSNSIQLAVFLPQHWINGPMVGFLPVTCSINAAGR